MGDELAGRLREPGFQDGEGAPHEGSRHDRDGDARLPAEGGEPVTEVLLQSLVLTVVLGEQ
jgi:hypothetical protein